MPLAKSYRLPRADGGKAGPTPEVTTDVTHEGPIHSSVAGRTDHLPMHVASGSYVIPADIISSLGEGNTMAGFKVMKRAILSMKGTPYKSEGLPYRSGAPYGAHGLPYGAGDAPYGAEMPGKARGGSTGLVPIVAAGGEYVIPPEDVTELGEGDIDLGHKILDEFVLKARAKTIKTLQKLPGPARD